MEIGGSKLEGAKQREREKERGRYSVEYRGTKCMCRVNVPTLLGLYTGTELRVP